MAGGGCRGAAAPPVPLGGEGGSPVFLINRPLFFEVQQTKSPFVVFFFCFFFFWPRLEIFPQDSAPWAKKTTERPVEHAPAPFPMKPHSAEYPFFFWPPPYLLQNLFLSTASPFRVSLVPPPPPPSHPYFHPVFCWGALSESPVLQKRGPGKPDKKKKTQNKGPRKHPPPPLVFFVF